MKEKNSVQSLHSLALEQDNVEAQRAAAEAIEIGRATLAQTAAQGEQLRRAERVADEAQYAVDKAGRVLRGMTWSGWVANLFTSDVAVPSAGDAADGSSPALASQFTSLASQAASAREPPLVYENVPELCRDAAQAVQNYHANLLVLLQCETLDQRATCRLICNDMYRVAEQQVQALIRGSVDASPTASRESASSARVFYSLVAKDLQILRSRQGPAAAQLPSKSTLPHSSSSLPPSPRKATTSSSYSSPGSNDRISRSQDRQDEHLSILSQNLDELGNLASSMRQSIGDQNRAVDRLNDKSDSIAEQTQRVTRRAERTAADMSSSWFFPSSRQSHPAYVARVIFRHDPTDKVLAVMQGDMYLLNLASNAPAASAAGVFLLYRRGMFVGLRHEASKAWVGQNLFGSLACTSATMGSREEWHVEDGGLLEGGTDGEMWSSFATTLLCASAGWGSGGYLYVRPRDQAVLIGGSSVEDKKRAAQWIVQNLPPLDRGLGSR